MANASRRVRRGKISWPRGATKEVRESRNARITKPVELLVRL